jgi:hypothetical protein
MRSHDPSLNLKCVFLFQSIGGPHRAANPKVYAKKVLVSGQGHHNRAATSQKNVNLTVNMVSTSQIRPYE